MRHKFVRAAVIILTAVLALTSSSCTKSGDPVATLQQWLWPPRKALPKVEPPKIEVPPVIVAPPKEPPKVELPKESPPPGVEAKTKAKPKPKRPKAPPVDESGPDLPWPCWLIRWHAAGKTDAELEAMRVAGGVPPLTPKQIRQAKECLAGLPR